MASAAWEVVAERRSGTRVLALPVRGILNAPSATGMRFWSLNPYVGCEFGCRYCYARRTHRWTVERTANLPGSPATAREAAALPSAESFERRILAKTDAPALLTRSSVGARTGGLPIVLGSATDPYQPAERQLRLTRRLLESLRTMSGLHLGIITKSALIARDAALLAELAERHRISVHISLASLDAALLRRLEPRTPTPRARLRALERLAIAGVPVGILVAPILPGLTDDAITLHTLLAAARAAGAQWAGSGALRLGPATRHTLLPWLDRHRPALARRYREHYGARQGASNTYQEALRERFARIAVAVGFDPSEGARRERGVMGPRVAVQQELFAEA